MTRTFILTIILIFGININSHAQNERDNLIQILNSKSVLIETDNVNYTLTTPPYWSLSGILENGELKLIDYRNGVWFGKNNYFIESTSLLKQSGSLIGEFDYKLEIWNYNDAIKTLDIEYYSGVTSYKVIRLNSKEIVLEDSDGCRYYFIAQTSLYNAPRNLQDLLKYDLQIKDLRDEWNQIRVDNNEKLYTIYSCEDFNEGIALVGIDTEHKADERNYGYGKKLFGYINEKGIYVIEPKYEKAFSFNGGFALVTTNLQNVSNWEFINKKGENIFNKKFVDARSFSEGFAAVKIENGGYCFIDKTGNFITKPIYEEVGDFKEGVARVKYQEKFGFIDKEGKEIIYPQFTSAHDFSEGLAAVSKEIDYHYTEYGFIDTKGQYLIKSERSSAFKILDDFKNGFALISKGTQQNSYGAFTYSDLGIVSKEGTTKYKNDFINLQNFSDGLALAQMYIGHQFGFVDEKLKYVIKPIFDDAGNFSEGFAKVAINENWGFIDKSGKVVINTEILKAKTDIQTSANFDAVSDFSEDFAIVQTRDKLGYIDKTGKFVIKPELLGAHNFKKGIARVKPSDRKGWNYIDKSGKILFTNFL
jgi:hypothetical protein